MFQTDLRKRSYEIRSIKYGHDMQYLLNQGLTSLIKPGSIGDLR